MRPLLKRMGLGLLLDQIRTYLQTFQVIDSEKVYSLSKWFLKLIVILVEMIREENETDRDLGVFDGEPKRRLGGSTEMLGSFETEDDVCNEIGRSRATEGQGLVSKT